MNRIRLRSVVTHFATMSLLLGLSVPAEARWPTRTVEPLIVSPDGSNAELLAACPDGSGGCYLAWDSYGAVWGEFLQHLNARGEAVLVTGGLEIRSTLGVPQNLAPDGSGGVIVLSAKYPATEPGGALWASRLTSGGVLEWSIQIASVKGQLFGPCKMIVEPSCTTFTAAWFAWGTDANAIGTQRFDVSGNVLWDPSGPTAISEQYIEGLESLVVDDHGGDWIGVTDRDSSVSPVVNIHVQHVDVGGAPTWLTRGVLVHASSAVEFGVSLVSDGDNGVYLAWHSQVPGNSWASVQHMRSDGSLGFGVDGRPVPEPADEFTGYPMLARAPGGRAFVAWSGSPTRGVTLNGLQQLDTTGTWSWPSPYVVASPDRMTVDSWGLFPNVDGGVTLFANASSLDLMSAQRFASDGHRLWGDAAPIIMSIPAGLDHYEYSFPGQLLPNGDGGVTMLYSDRRGYSDTFHVRAQHLDPYGRLGDTAPAILSLQDVPDDHGGFLQVHWRASSLQGDSAMSTTMYQVLRRQPGAHDPIDSVVGELTATNDTEYAAIVPTLGDSLSSTSRPTTLLIRAQDATGRTWVSLPDSAHSVANLASLGVGPGHDLLSLDPPEPSPASARARIRYSLPMSGLMSLALYDLAGRRVRTLIRGEQAEGQHAETIELVDVNGERLSAGLYFMRLEVPGGELRRNLVVIR